MTILFAFFLSISGQEIKTITPYETHEECSSQLRHISYTTPSNLIFIGGYCFPPLPDEAPIPTPNPRTNP